MSIYESNPDAVCQMNGMNEMIQYSLIENVLHLKDIYIVSESTHGVSFRAIESTNLLG